jgi:Spy/CpxP family protein refolding chaperone
MSKRSLVVATVLAGISLMSGNRALAQSPSDEDINLFRKDVRSLKKQIIAANMDLTDTEAQQFWPIYDRYAAELVTITDTKYALLKEYAQNYNTMTSEQAESYIKERAAVEGSIMQLRLKYLPVLRKVLSGKATALFFQMDWRLSLIMDLQLASQTPLIEP